MLNRLILKVTKFQLPPPKRSGAVVKNIQLGGHDAPPCQIGLKPHFRPRHPFFTSKSLQKINIPQKPTFNQNAFFTQKSLQNIKQPDM